MLLNNIVCAITCWYSPFLISKRSIRARAPANTVTAESGHLVPANLKKAPLPPTQRAVAHGIPTALLSSPTSPSSQPCTTPLIQHSSGNIDAEVLAKHTQMLNSLLYAYDAIKKVIMAPEVVEGVATGLCEGKHIKVSSTLERQHHHTSQKMSSPFSSTTPHSSSLTASSSTRRHLMDGGFIGKLISRYDHLPFLSDQHYFVYMHIHIRTLSTFCSPPFNFCFLLTTVSMDAPFYASLSHFSIGSLCFLIHIWVCVCNHIDLDPFPLSQALQAHPRFLNPNSSKGTC